MRLISTVFAGIVAAVALTAANSAHAVVVTAQLDQVNNGNVITQPSQIIDVSADNTLGPAWRITVGGGLNFEQFFFNYDQPLQASDVVLTGSSAGQWSADTNGATASNFGQFSFKWDGPPPAGLASLTFDILAAGNLVPNGDGAIFAAKIASQAGGNAGGFVSTESVSAVPIPGAVWLMISALAALLGLTRRRARPAAAH
jgi:hypothetical protein